jgi:NADPH-dependent curcumin reductase CurA
MMQRQYIELARIPSDGVEAADFAIRRAEGTLSVGPGEVMVRAEMFGLNAGLKSRLGTGLSTTLGPAIGIGDTPQSDAIGTVVDSRDGAVPVGSTVVGLMPWADLSIRPGKVLRVIDRSADRLQHLTVLGHVGLTAFSGLITVGRLAEGETVWISAAAGGVGVCAVQFARALGATVIASASGEDRLRFLRDELGVEKVMDRNDDLEAQLRDLAPDGVDLYFDAVGGNHLLAALPAMRERGRIVLVGRVGGHRHPPILADSSLLIRRRISMTGFSVTDHPESRVGLEELVAAAGQKIKAIATVRSGLSMIPAAFADLLAGRFIGRGVVDVRTAE